MHEMLEFLHGAPYAVCVELKNFNLCVLYSRSFVCFVCGSVRMWGAGVGAVGGRRLEVCVMGICGESWDV